MNEPLNQSGETLNQNEETSNEIVGLSNQTNESTAQANANSNNRTDKPNNGKVKDGSGCLAATLIGGVLFVFLMICGIYVWSSYNTLVKSEQSVESSWADVQTAYQKRADLIPNLVETVKGYAAHEKETLTAVIEARAAATSANISADKLDNESFAQFQAAQDQVSNALGRLLAVREAYPKLKADAHFMELMGELKVVESEIAAKREAFNTAVKDYNVLVKKFPKNLVAKMFGFNERAYFEASQAAQEAPKVQF